MALCVQAGSNRMTETCHAMYCAVTYSVVLQARSVCQEVHRHRGLESFERKTIRLYELRAIRELFAQRPGGQAIIFYITKKVRYFPSDTSDRNLNLNLSISSL